MNKRIVICADGTWNRPEEDVGEDFPTNVLRIARAIKPVGAGQTPQQVFYDWGIGSYYDSKIGGATGRGIQKNIVDGYRYIVQNYKPGDDIYLFGFSRGSYTVRSLSGLINNCGIVKRPDAPLIAEAFANYKKTHARWSPGGDAAKAFRAQYSHPSRRVRFMGLFDTVGALGVPFSVMGLLDDKDEFYDTKLGPNVEIARHALAIDEQRIDFLPTLIQPRAGVDLDQVWFAGAHSDVGGSTKPDRRGLLLSDVALEWMLGEAGRAGLTLEPHLRQELAPVATAKINPSRRGVFRARPKRHRTIEHLHGPVRIHASVKTRWDRDRKYRPKNLKEYVDAKGWPPLVP